MALWKFFTLEDPEKGPDKKYLRAICKKFGFPCQWKQGLPTGIKQHLERKHYELYQQFKKLEVH